MSERKSREKKETKRKRKKRQRERERKRKGKFDITKSNGISLNIILSSF